jgi:hypothetical protein
VLGQVASAITAEIRVGGQERQFDDDAYDDETQFFMESLLSWVASDLTTVDFSIGNGFDTTIDDISTETFFAELGLRHQFSEKIRASAGLGYEDVKYSDGRDDEQFSVEIGCGYTLIEDQLQIEGGCRYADRDSNQDDSNYEVVTFVLSIAYLF